MQLFRSNTDYNPHRSVKCGTHEHTREVEQVINRCRLPFPPVAFSNTKLLFVEAKKDVGNFRSVFCMDQKTRSEL